MERQHGGCHQLRTADVVEVAAVLILQRKYIHSVGLMLGNMSVFRQSRPSFNIYYPPCSSIHQYLTTSFATKSCTNFQYFFSIQSRSTKTGGKK